MPARSPGRWRTTLGPEHWTAPRERAAARELLHDGAVARALRNPERIALIAGAGVVSYGELLHRALGVAERLLDGGCDRARWSPW